MKRLRRYLKKEKSKTSIAIVETIDVGPLVLSDTCGPSGKGVDLVFVHGLRGNRISTWSTPEACWPRDFLKDDIEYARVITWGHDSSVANVTAYASKESVFGHASTLLEDLARLRQGVIHDRPIVFLGHSLGGLIVKEALITSASYKSNNQHPALGAIYASTRGVIFLGTPHRGSDKETLAHIIGLIAMVSLRQPNQQLLESLQPDSHNLERQRQAFVSISNNMPVVCFREELPSSIGIIVPAASASYDGFNVRNNSVKANHRDMVKFATKADVGYQRVLGHILELVRLAEKEQDEEVTRSIETRRDEILTALGYANLENEDDNVGDAYSDTFTWIWNGVTEESQPSPTPSPSPLVSLLNQMFDPDSVKNSTNKTRFPEWLLSHQNTFWISGKAGCGKSTLMKYLYRHPTTKELLRRWAGDKRLVLAGFFIFERGSKLQKSREGMLRSILYQILSRDRNLISVAFDKYFGTTMDSANAGLMTYGALRKAFEAVLDHLEGCKVCLFIDGLDEYRVVDGLDKYKPKDFNLSFTSSNQQERLWGRSAWITDGHKEIIGLFQRLKNWRDFKLCLSSRELPLFEQAFWSIPKMRLHELTLEDIKRYCDGRLEDEAPCMPDRASLSKAIVSKSSGVFLWVRLVIDMLVEGNANGDTPAELWSTLTSLPDELGGRDGLYARMLFNIRPDHRGESSRMLALTLRAVNPLDPVMLSFGLEAATVPDVPRDPFSPKTVQELLSEVDRMKSRLRSRTAGLLEAEPKVQFMHLTAKEFVSRPDIQEMVTKWSTAALDEVDLNLALLSGCIRRLKCCAGSIPELEPPNAVQENIMDIWRTVHIPVEGFIYISDAMHYARRVDARLRSIHERRELYTALLDELDNTGQYLARMIEEQHVRRLGRPGREQDRWPELEPMETGPVPVRGNFAEYAIQAGLAAYLEVKLEHSTREQLLASATSLLGQATMAQSYGTTALEIRGLAQTRFGAIVPEPQVLEVILAFLGKTTACDLLNRNIGPNEAMFVKDGMTLWGNTLLCGQALFARRQREDLSENPESEAEALNDQYRRRWISIVKLLIQHGADVRAQFILAGTTPVDVKAWLRTVLSSTPAYGAELSELEDLIRRRSRPDHRCAPS